MQPQCVGVIHPKLELVSPVPCKVVVLLMSGSFIILVATLHIIGKVRAKGVGSGLSG